MPFASLCSTLVIIFFYDCLFSMTTTAQGEYLHPDPWAKTIEHVKGAALFLMDHEILPVQNVTCKR